MLKLLAVVIALVLILAVTAVVMAFLSFRGEIDRDTRSLVSSAEVPAPSTITEAMLAELPAPARRYFRFAGVVGQPVPRLVHLTQRGRIRSSNEARWMDFEADETYSTSPPAFVWRAFMPTPVDDTNFEVQITDRDMSAEATLSVDADGRLTNFRAQRYNTGSRSMETWETPITKYGEFSGLKLPARGAAIWKLATGDLDYIELDVLSVVYQ